MGAQGTFGKDIRFNAPYSMSCLNRIEWDDGNVGACTRGARELAGRMRVPGVVEALADARVLQVQASAVCCRGAR